MVVVVIDAARVAGKVHFFEEGGDGEGVAGSFELALSLGSIYFSPFH